MRDMDVWLSKHPSLLHGDVSMSVLLSGLDLRVFVSTVYIKEMLEFNWQFKVQRISPVSTIACLLCNGKYRGA